MFCGQLDEANETVRKLKTELRDVEEKYNVARNQNEKNNSNIQQLIGDIRQAEQKVRPTFKVECVLNKLL